MKVMHKGRAGTMESGDVFVTVEPAPSLKISLESPVKAQFGPAILATVRQVLDEWGVQEGLIELWDQGALDCTIRARLTTALRRACKDQEDSP